MVEINAQQYQHATTKFVLIGKKQPNLRLRTISKCSYKVSAKKELTNDGEGQPDGFVFKKVEQEAAFTMKQAEWDKMRQWLLAEAAPLGTLQAQFDLAITRGNRINAVKTDTLRTVMIQEEARASEDSQEPHMVDVPLLFVKGDFADGPAIVFDP